MEVDVRRARPDEVDLAIDILAEVTAWVQSKGISQWPAQ